MQNLDKLIGVLNDTKERLSGSGESVWSNCTCAELVALINQNLERIVKEGTYDRQELDLLYAPTTSLQDTAIDNGWGQEFLVLAERYDAAVGR
jgi:hypothetical protein